ncbi:BTB/POZ domain-containing protein NPY4 [Canna indica]|uniref:BTB/POZ domain-containing protein NPY4 n=1 Tax=Canna indica TaxID=4628 RepID=A0AAQ3Q8I8_9LILI|nr:BTB/POZ domain-containing protein NPY4 [Canna indica]
MKFMKLGSKPDSFQSKGPNIRFVQSELATDIIINVGEVIFHLHKFPLLSKCSRIQNLVSTTMDDILDEIHIPDIPGGPAAFEICAKFCYGMTVTLNAYNVASVRCAAEYLEMHDTVEKGNLIYKIEVFLGTSIFHAWKDSIILLRTMKSLLPWSEDLKLVSNCVDSIASKASVNASKVEWSFTYNRKKVPSENGLNPLWNGIRKEQTVPIDWWVEDLCELQLDFYKRIIVTIKAKGRVPDQAIGESLKAYTYRWLSNFDAASMNSADDAAKNRLLLQTIIWLLPAEKGSISCRFLLKLLRAVDLMDCSEVSKKELIKQIGHHLEYASVTDLLIPATEEQDTTYDIDMITSIAKEFMVQNSGVSRPSLSGTDETATQNLALVADCSKIAVSKLVDCYLAEIAKDPHLLCSKFTYLAELIPGKERPTHDGLYHAIDMYLKEHPSLSKTEKKRLCGLLDCKKLSAEISSHAVQNDRLPLRVVVQILFFEQMRATSDGSGSYGSSRSAITTNPGDEWDRLPTVEDLRSIKSMKLTNGAASGDGDGRESNYSSNNGKTKLPRRMLGELLSSKRQETKNSSSSNTSVSE